jgi:N-acyl-D-amino-acid deacylase
MLDLVIKNAKIVDGTGNPWFAGDVGVKDGEISDVGRVKAPGRETVDAGGLVLAPGFVDGHCHSDLRSYVEPVLGTTNREWSWETVGRYVESVKEARPAGNIATYVGHGTLRIAAMGFDDRPATEREMDLMKAMLREGMEAGAIGLSLGLMYAPGSYTAREELVELCRVLAEYDGLLATHIRGEGGSLISSIEEVIWIAERSGVALQISHLKAAGKRNWGGVNRAMDVIQNARSRGLDIACDVYPYTAGSTSLTTLLPPWTLEGGIARTLERLAEPETRRRISDELRHEQSGWDNLVASTGWESVYVSSLSRGRNPEIEGRHVAEIAEERGVEPSECMMDLLLENDGKVSIVFFHMAGGDVEAVIRWDNSLIASDSLHCQADKPHPRLYGTFPRILGEYVREKGVLSLEEAVRKMTSFPARRFRLGRRGLIAPGHAADLVLFDPDTVADRTNYEEPKRFPEGIARVFVNGKQTINNESHSGERPGRVVVANIPQGGKLT